MPTEKVALITGITGQDGSYLAEFLLEKGYTVHGIMRRSSHFNSSRIDKIFDHLTIHYGDMVDSSSLVSIISRVKPDEIYNLAAQSHVKVSFEVAEYTSDVVALGTLRLLEALRLCHLQNCRVYQASSSELYGNSTAPPQNEDTIFQPRSPYAISKLYAFWISVNYREAYGLFVSNGILFNHESPRRGGTFVTKKIVNAVALIICGLQKEVVVGNLDACRDWGHAKDYVEAMWMILQHETPDDFVISTGTRYSVREFIRRTFLVCGYKITFKGNGLEEVGSVKRIANTNQPPSDGGLLSSHSKVKLIEEISEKGYHDHDQTSDHAPPHQMNCNNKKIRVHQSNDKSYPNLNLKEIERETEKSMLKSFCGNSLYCDSKSSSHSVISENGFSVGTSLDNSTKDISQIECSGGQQLPDDQSTDTDDSLRVDVETQIVVRVSKAYFRPTEVNCLQGDSSKAKRLLGWVPKVSLNDLIHEMLEAEFETLGRIVELHRIN